MSNSSVSGKNTMELPSSSLRTTDFGGELSEDTPSPDIWSRATHQYLFGVESYDLPTSGSMVFARGHGGGTSEQFRVQSAALNMSRAVGVVPFLRQVNVRGGTAEVKKTALLEGERSGSASAGREECFCSLTTVVGRC